MDRRFNNGMDHPHFKRLALGEKRNRLTLIGVEPPCPDGNTKIRCLCDCGIELVVRKQLFLNGHTKSCGCLRAEVCGSLRANLLPVGESSLNSLYKSYQRQATKRGLSFEITLEDFKSITSKNCVYCGAIPAGKTHWRKRNGVYTFNGIDRVDNLKGYAYGNIVPCCKMCQYAKRSNSVDDFLNWAKRLAEHQGKFPFPVVGL